MGATVGNVAGSLIANANNTAVTFINTDEIAGLSGNDSTGQQGLLTWNKSVNPQALVASDTFLATLAAGANGFEAANNGSALTGSTTFGFTVTSPPPAAVVVSIPDFARGPDGADTINLPNNSSNGIPLQVSNGSGLTAATFTVTYNPALLNVIGAFANTALMSSNGASLSINMGASTPGNLVLNFTTTSALPSGPVVLGGLVATVPANALYGSKEQLQIGSTLLAGATPVASINDNAVQVVAYQGDTSGLGLANYTGADATLVLRASTFFDGSNSGFGPFETLDPVILGDIDNDGKLTGNDATLISRYLGGGSVPQIANRPGATPGDFNPGPDPSLSLPPVLTAGADGTVLVPVNIDDPKPVGSPGMLSAQLALRYDPTKFNVTPQDIQLGSVPFSAGDWTVSAVVDAATGEIGVTIYGLTPIDSTNAGSLVTVTLHEKSSATPAETPIALVASVDLNGRPFTTRVDDVNGPFTLNPAPSNSGTRAEPSRPPPRCCLAPRPWRPTSPARNNRLERRMRWSSENTATIAADVGSATLMTTDAAGKSGRIVRKRSGHRANHCVDCQCGAVGAPGLCRRPCSRTPRRHCSRAAASRISRLCRSCLTCRWKRRRQTAMCSRPIRLAWPLSGNYLPNGLPISARPVVLQCRAADLAFLALGEGSPASRALPAAAEEDEDTLLWDRARTEMLLARGRRARRGAGRRSWPRRVPNRRQLI